MVFPTIDRVRFVEDMSALFQRAGLQQQGGAILAHMLVTERAWSVQELVDVLALSKAQTTLVLNTLLRDGLLETVQAPAGRRPGLYRVHPEVWTQLARQRLQVFRELQQLATQGMPSPRPAEMPPVLRRIYAASHALERRLRQVVEGEGTPPVHPNLTRGIEQPSLLGGLQMFRSRA